VDGLWATKSEDVGLIVRAVSFQDFQDCALHISTSRGKNEDETLQNEIKRNEMNRRADSVQFSSDEMR